MIIMPLQDHHDLEKFYILLYELRPHLSFEAFKEIYHEAKENHDYEIVGLEENHNLVGLMGYRVISDFVHGRHLYIDDLVVSEKVRSKGHGAFLLKHAEEKAKELGCTNLRLCTGVENQRGKVFYEKNGWSPRALAFKKRLS